MARDETLNGMYSPYDVKGEINKVEAPYQPNAPMTTLNLGGFNPGFDTATNRAIDSGYYGVFNELSPENQAKARGQGLSETLTRTNVYGTGQIPGLNFGGGVTPNSDLLSMENKRRDILQQSQMNFNQLQDAAFQGRNLLENLPANGLGRLSLLNRVESQFGPGWRSDPQARGLVENFDAQMAQGQDIETLNGLNAQGKSVSDYINDSNNGPQFRYIIKLGDQILQEAGFRPETNGSDQFILNHGLSGRLGNVQAREFFTGGNYR